MLLPLRLCCVRAATSAGSGVPRLIISVSWIRHKKLNGSFARQLAELSDEFRIGRLCHKMAGVGR
ncbi:hypothetical protein [Kitasatospora purpeofusca]|uniref:hypothetical protein n=1 Tax=Kitasatospora purpeofusca TaxID=67352 RepID=UPI0036D2C7A9